MTCRDDVASHNREMRIFIGLEAGRARLGCLATGLKAGCGNHTNIVATATQKTALAIAWPRVMGLRGVPIMPNRAIAANTFRPASTYSA